MPGGLFFPSKQEGESQRPIKTADMFNRLNSESSSFSSDLNLLLFNQNTVLGIEGMKRKNYFNRYCK